MQGTENARETAAGDDETGGSNNGGRTRSPS